MTYFSINQTPNTPQGPQATGPSQQTVQQNGSNPKDIKIFDFGGDKNQNEIVDIDDFDNPETLKMYQDKGLIGKPWTMIKEKLGELFNLKNVTAKSSSTLFSGSQVEESWTYDNSGRITKREYVQTAEKDDGCPGEGSVYTPNIVKDVVINSYDNYQYDEKGNPISYDITHANIHDGIRRANSDYTVKVNSENTYDKNGVLVEQSKTYDIGISKSVVNYEYNSNGDLIKHSEGYFGKAPSSFTTYEYDNNGKVIKRNGKDITEN